MASSNNTAPIGAKEIGSFFVQHYYDVLQKDPQSAHRFYNEGSSVVLVGRNGGVDTDSSETASTLTSINDLLTSLNYTAVMIETVNAVDSWNGGIAVVLSGRVETKVNFEGGPTDVRKKFMQTFFLAPQEKGYFVMTDIVHYLSEEAIGEHAYSEGSEQHVDEGEPEYDEALEAEGSEYVESVHLEKEQFDTDHSFHEHDHEHNHEPETVEEEAPLEVSNAFQHSDEHPETQQSLPVVEEPVGEPIKFSYASIVRASKGNPTAASSIQPSYVKKAPPLAVQQPRPAVSVASDGAEGVSGRSLPQIEGESKSVYVKNLPPGISTHEVLEEFKNFGRIKQDGIYVKTNTETGFCFGFVDFEDSESAQNAVKASPMSLDGRQVSVEFKRSTGGPPRGGRGGRGGGGRGNTYGRQSGRY